MDPTLSRDPSRAVEKIPRRCTFYVEIIFSTHQGRTDEYTEYTEYLHLRNESEMSKIDDVSRLIFFPFLSSRSIRATSGISTNLVRLTCV